MNYHESLQSRCNHKPYRLVRMSDFYQWRCRCGKIVGRPLTVIERDEALARVLGRTIEYKS
jgi:hypothetical protein